MSNSFESVGRALDVSDGAFDASEFGGPSGGGGPIDTTPQGTPRERAEGAGFTVNNTKTVSTLDAIGGAKNTLYIIDGANGPLTMGGKHGLGTVNDVAICGKNNARLVIPSGYVGYALTTSGGTGILWSGIDLDQRNSNSRGRLNLKANGKSITEYTSFIGHGTRSPAYGGGPPSGYPGTLINDDDPIYGGPSFHPAALSANGTTIMRHCDFEHGGHMEYEHSYQAGGIGIFLAGQHKGTLKIQNCRFAAFPGDALYASNTTGSVECDNVIWHTNGTAQGRIANGHFKNCMVVFDYNDTALDGTKNTNNGCLGLEAEAKMGTSNVDIIGCSVYMTNVDKCPAGIAARNLTDPGNIGEFRDNDVHISDNADNAADVWVNPGSTVGSMTNNTFSGTATSGVSILNQGTINSRSGNTFDYPPGRNKNGS